MTGETNLHQLIANMSPVLNEGEYVFVTVASTENIPRSIVVCEMKEKEGITLVLPKQEADTRALTYDYIAAWITLNIHSSLEAVGLTAAFATELAKHHISCNVIAGYYHDHIFIDLKDSKQAMKVLHAMAEEKQQEIK